MADPGVPADYREAALEMHRYMAGDIAPMMVADTLESLAAQPPQLLARVLADWIIAQSGSSGEEIGDLIFHALTKVHQLAEFGLVREERMLRLLQALSRLLVQLCPEDERASVLVRLSRIGEVATAVTPKASFLHRDAAAGTVTPSAAPRPDAARHAAVDRGMRKLTLLLERLGRTPIVPGMPGAPAAAGTTAGPEVPTDPTLLARVLTTAALESRTPADLEQYLAQVRERGLTAPVGDLFQVLGRSLPGWALEGAAAPTARPIEAMNRLVALAPDTTEAARRLGGMVYAAIEQFNEGRLAQCVSILDAVARLIAEKKPDASMVATTLSQAQGSLADPMLKKLAENPEKQSLMHKVVAFFPAYRPEGILEALLDEPRRERRKLLLSLYACHGEDGRAPLLARMDAHARGEIRDPAGWYKRNLVFLVRRLPETGEKGLRPLLPRLEAALRRGEAAMVVKEAAGVLGQLRHPESEAILTARLDSLENELSAPGARPDADTADVLDRLCAAIARQGTSSAIRTIVAHAYRTAPALGDANARLDHLAWLDLSIDPEQLGALVTAIKDGLSTSFLGIGRKRTLEEMVHLVRAVSGTPTPEVRSVLAEIAKRYEGKGPGEEAARALAKLDTKTKAPTGGTEALSGDLELFALPNLLSSLGDSQSTGELVLFDRGQARQASVSFAKGRVAAAATRNVQGLDAIYQVLEKPFPGTFVFRAGGKIAAGAEEPADVVAVMLEGMRRHDEYQGACAMVPDGLAYEPAGASPTAPEDETNADLMREVWLRASKGVPAEECEVAFPVDPYRVRRMYAQWLETGALRPKGAARAREKG